MSSNPRWEPSIKLEKRGHRIFRDASDDYRAPEARRDLPRDATGSAWAIADESGSTPDRTDDGILWLDFERPIEACVGEYPGARLPVFHERRRSHDCHVLVGIDAFAAIRERFPEWPLTLSESAQRFVQAASAPVQKGPSPLLLELIAATDGRLLRRLLHEYEATGDHDHGRGPIQPGGRCPGGDCWVHRARRVLDAIDSLNLLNHFTSSSTTSTDPKESA